ncbi:MAG: hypothetical protein KZQ93_16150 [Candidatus Thiodiazotropha sp. (ex Monitilora ramsayi)]|nr:hypothetical protein [Candidatus Thiodiazotropha sp. (ex Monitilora ramsayi)]
MRGTLYVLHVANALVHVDETEISLESVLDRDHLNEVGVLSRVEAWNGLTSITDQ